MRNRLIVLVFISTSCGAWADGVWRLSSTNYHVDPSTRCGFDEKAGDAGDVVVKMSTKCMGEPFPTFKIRAQWTPPPQTLIPGQVIPWEMVLTPQGCSGSYNGFAHLSATILEYDYMGPLNASCGSAQAAPLRYVNKDRTNPLKAPPAARAWSKTFTLQVKIAADSDWMWDYVYTFYPEGGAGVSAPTAQAAAGGNISGTWNSSEGVLQLKQTGNVVSGSYPTSEGRIIGTINNGTLSGYWIQNRSQRQCGSSVEGSNYWGKIQWAFSGNGFTGKWGYCNDTPTENWTGSR